MLLRRLLILALLSTTGCSGQVATPTPAVAQATVTDYSVPFNASENAALAPGPSYGAFGHLNMGCTVEVVKTTDRAAQVKFVSCPDYARDNMTPSAPVIGWVAKSALNLH